ncbi:phage baseplate plug family protein, partial [Pantoea agglomerans]|uniref:phage baseplate plug family protein n=1 Tax=Enterobacter agglomerans TaxID=549 RepID=UPI0024137B90
MATLYRLAVSSDPYQTLKVTVGSTKYQLSLRYNPVPPGGQWLVDIADANTSQALISGYALVCGVPVLKRTRLPFWLYLYDSSGNALNP